MVRHNDDGHDAQMWCAAEDGEVVAHLSNDLLVRFTDGGEILRMPPEKFDGLTAWHESGYVFTTAGGAPPHPDWITRRFRRLVELSGLPPARLHDLRHGAATLAYAAGADLKTVQEQLGRTSIVLTADTYTSVLLELHFKVAEATARLVLEAAARNPGRRYRSKIGPPKSAGPDLPTAARCVSGVLGPTPSDP